MTRYAIHIAAAVLAAYAALWATQPTPAPGIVAQAEPVAHPPAPADERERWARDLLARLGNDAPTQATVDMVVEWTIAEDACLRECGHSSAFERNNPLNTTQAGFGATHAIDGDGVKAYPTYEQGMAATLQTLSYGYYTEIVAALLANEPEQAKRALWNSPWAASHYGYGASWPKRGN